MNGIIYRGLLTSEEAGLAADIEKECLSTAWSEAQISMLPEYAVYIGAFDGETLCGVASMYAIAGEGQIMNVAVSQNHRRKGIAFGLMNEIIARATEKDCENITLEVAENNQSAISLYEKCGFCTVGRRKGFYDGTDAFIMEKKL